MDGVVRAPEGNSVPEDNVKNRAIEEGKIGEKEVDRNRGRINGKIEAIPEGISASTLDLISDTKGDSNPVPRGLRVGRLEEKDDWTPGISSDVRLGARIGDSTLGVTRVEVNPESHLSTSWCGELGRKAGAHDEGHYTEKGVQWTLRKEEERVICTLRMEGFNNYPLV